MKSLTGNITHYLFRNDDNGFSIAKIALESMDEVIITGYLPELSKEVTYTFNVEETTHPKYGLQYKVISFSKAEVQNKEGIIAYLSSDLFTGIGPVRAKKIVDTLGDDAIKKILENKTVLLNMGLNRLQIERFYKQLHDNQVVESTLVSLYGFGLTSKMAMKLYAKYGSDALDRIKDNPYRLIEDIDGVGFKRADILASVFGIKNDDQRRLEAALLFGIQTVSFQRGDTYILDRQLVNACLEILGNNIREDLIIEALKRLIESERIIKKDHKYYLDTVYRSEADLAIELKRLKQTQAIIDENEALNLIWMTEKKLNITYTQKQKEAIISALSSSISVITGGPGTGKTTIIHGLLEIYAIKNELDLELESASEQILLIAPTGRASRRMQTVMSMKALTIHRALGYNYEGAFYYNETIQLPHQLVIIDEASMIDVFLAENLFKAIKTGAQVVIVGDKDQLPSVGPGQILSDIIESGCMPVIALKEIHRQAKNSGIIDLALRVNNQTVDSTDYESKEDIKFITKYESDIIDVMIGTIDEALDQGYSLKDDIQVLIPIYKGGLGIDAVNLALQRRYTDLTKKKVTYGDKTYVIGDKVIQLANNPEKGIMNGDIGIIKDISKDQNNSDILYIDFDDHVVVFSKGELDDLNLAYAISIHKSQGSEYKVVIMPLVRSYARMLRKELLYTGITRTKSHLTLVGDLSLIEKASVVLNEKRQTTLKDFLSDISEEKKASTVSPYDFL
ncbi:MAG: ATP-dependent RecD-like DNA helicase [Acholeplasma sp.]|nr:ATP-dependent RecD-like DNA helicase [Acholeplasma sp.]